MFDFLTVASSSTTVMMVMVIVVMVVLVIGLNCFILLIFLTGQCPADSVSEHLRSWLAFRFLLLLFLHYNFLLFKAGVRCTGASG